MFAELRSVRFAPAILLAGGLGLCAQNPSATPAGKLYFVAATATNSSPETFPATLYRSGGKLLPVRTLAAASAGVYLVAPADTGVIAVVSPAVTPARIEIVHEDDPDKSDSVALNFGKAVALNSLNCLIARKGATYELLATVPSQPPGSTEPVTVWKVLLSAAGGGQDARVSKGAPEDYAEPEDYGVPGGPMPGFTMFASRVGDRLLMRIGASRIPLDTCPRDAPFENGKEDAGIVASSASYRIYSLVHAIDQLAAIRETTLYVHNLRTGKWKRVEVPGNDPRSRLCGGWLASIAEFWQPNSPANPGRAAERSRATKELPNVQAYYASFEGRDHRIPGILTLCNLEDGRRVTLNTQAEDSEVLLVTAQNQVVYRVNDSIYQAPIQGATLGPAVLVVHDEAVPEIHWAFFSSGGGAARP